MDNKVYLAEDDEIADIARALSSKLRRGIIKLLGNKKMNVGEIARAMEIPQSTCVVNIQLLEKAKIVKTEQVAASKGLQKICYIPYHEIVLPLVSETYKEGHYIVTEMPIGLFTNCEISAPCGMNNDKGMIGYFDHTDSFFDPKRATAGMLWFTRGFCEYRFPKDSAVVRKVKSISVSMELCSEYPGYNNDWPSDITLWLNGEEVGTWRSPGDLGSTYGRLTPRWWDLQNTQYGMIKTWKVTQEGSFIDGEPSGSLRLSDIDYMNCPHFLVKIGIKEDADFQGGINIFGRTFGNYEQDIILRVELEN